MHEVQRSDRELLMGFDSLKMTVFKDLFGVFYRRLAQAAFNTIRKVVPMFSSEDFTKIFPSW